MSRPLTTVTSSPGWWGCAIPTRQGLAGRGLAGQLNVPAAVDCVVRGATGAQDVAGALDRPTLDHAGRVEPAGRPHREVAVAGLGQSGAQRQDGPHVGVAVGRRELTAVESADLAVRPVRREGPVHPVQPLDGVGQDGRRHLVAQVERDDSAHDVLDVTSGEAAGGEQARYGGNPTHRPAWSSALCRDLM
jgi:hypothetical protein